MALTTFSDLVAEAREKNHHDALASGLTDDNKGLNTGGTSALAYAEAVSVYLAFAVNRCADFSNSVTRWVPGNQKVMNLFGKQAIAMTWDYPEANILADTVGGFSQVKEYISSCIKKLSPSEAGFSIQFDAQTQTTSVNKVVSTDPPYYDNIGYADLSDFSIFGCVGRYDTFIRSSLPLWLYPRPRSWSQRLIVTAAKKKQRLFSSMG